MTYLDEPEQPYPNTMNFERDRLLGIRPDDVARRFFNLMAYGTATPGPEDHPTHCRSTTLAMAMTNVRLQSCVDGVTDEQTQDKGTYQDPPNGPTDEDMTSQIPIGSRSHRNVDDISRSPEREQESEHT